MSRALRQVMVLVWAGISLATTVMAAAPFVLSDRAIAHLVPMCESKRIDGRPCFLCGTTSGFVAISRGDWETAGRSNRLAIPLFALFSVNAAAVAALLATRLNSR